MDSEESQVSLSGLPLSGLAGHDTWQVGNAQPPAPSNHAGDLGGSFLGRVPYLPPEGATLLFQKPTSPASQVIHSVSIYHL